jgi:hypothetical protein
MDNYSHWTPSVLPTPNASGGGDKPDKNKARIDGLLFCLLIQLLVGMDRPWAACYSGAAGCAVKGWQLVHQGKKMPARGGHKSIFVEWRRQSSLSQIICCGATNNVYRFVILACRLA